MRTDGSAGMLDIHKGWETPVEIEDNCSIFKQIFLGEAHLRGKESMEHDWKGVQKINGSLLLFPSFFCFTFEIGVLQNFTVIGKIEKQWITTAKWEDV